jgi:hypothetical protein
MNAHSEHSVIAQFHLAQANVDLHANDNKSLYLFRLDSSVRLLCAKIQSSKVFSDVIMGLILFSCVSLAAEGRGDADSGSWMQDNVPRVFGISLFTYLNVIVLGTAHDYSLTATQINQFST